MSELVVEEIKYDSLTPEEKLMFLEIFMKVENSHPYCLLLTLKKAERQLNEGNWILGRIFGQIRDFLRNAM